MIDHTLTYTPEANNHDLIYGLASARLLIGHGCEPWLVRTLCAWITAAEAELERRGLLKEARRVHGELLVAHRTQATTGHATNGRSLPRPAKKTKRGEGT